MINEIIIEIQIQFEIGVIYFHSEIHKTKLTKNSRNIASYETKKIIYYIQQTTFSKNKKKHKQHFAPNITCCETPQQPYYPVWHCWLQCFVLMVFCAQVTFLHRNDPLDFKSYVKCDCQIPKSYGFHFIFKPRQLIKADVCHLIDITVIIDFCHKSQQFHTSNFLVLIP